MKAKTTVLAIERLRFDDACYPRVAADDARVEHLADLLAAGQKLPPVLIERASHIVLGGRHTIEAHRRRGATLVPVRLVDVKPDDRLLFAYRQDAAAALPYHDVDVQKVARLEYERRRANGGTTAEAIAKELGRSARTVQRWLTDLIDRDDREREHKRQARLVAVAAFVAAGVSQQRIAAFLGVGQRQVSSDGHVAATANLHDSRVVSTAQSLIHLALGQGATRAEVKAATDWLLAKTQPEAVAAARANRTLGLIESDLTRALELLTHADTLDALDASSLAALPPHALGQWHMTLARACEQAAALIASIQRKVPNAPID